MIGFILAENVLSSVYESLGMFYSGNEGTVVFGLSFMLFCSYTLFRRYVLSQKSPLLDERMTSLTFWLVLIWSVYSVVSPFVKGEM